MFNVASPLNLSGKSLELKTIKEEKSKHIEDQNECFINEVIVVYKSESNIRVL